jgi:uncharacterized protein
MIACSTGRVRAAMVGLALFGFVGSAMAQKSPSPAAIATARQLIEIKGVGQLYNPVLVGIILRARDTLMQTNPNLSSDLNAAAQQLRKDYEPRLDALKQQIATMYAAQLTEQELKDALAFYKSPLGIKLVKVEPQVLDQSMAVADKWANQLAEEVLDKMRAEMRKKGHQL